LLSSRDYESLVVILDLKFKALLLGLSFPRLPTALSLRTLSGRVLFSDKTSVFALSLVGHQLSAVIGNLPMPDSSMLLLLVTSYLVCPTLMQVDGPIEWGRSFRDEIRFFFRIF
jgi:hypothetical protein